MLQGSPPLFEFGCGAFAKGADTSDVGLQVMLGQLPQEGNGLLVLQSFVY